MSKPFVFPAAALLRPWCRALGIAWLALGSLGLAGADELQGRVVKVADGVWQQQLQQSAEYINDWYPR